MSDRPMLFARAVALAALLLAATGCSLFRQFAGQPAPRANAAGAAGSIPRRLVTVPARIVPLPGGLNETRLFDSNSPEIVQAPGILLSTLTPAPGAPTGIHLDTTFLGRFAVFSHHIAKDALPGEHLLMLGLLAVNDGSRAADVQRVQGASYLSQPEAPFKVLPGLVDDAAGLVFAGPGDRVATDMLHGRSPMTPTRFLIAPGETRLLSSLSVPTNVPIPPPINGRTTLAYFEASQPIRLAEVALFAQRGPDGRWIAPSASDYEAVLAANVLAGPREVASTPYTPGGPVPRGFRYGRVAGVALGDAWTGSLFGGAGGPPLPAAGETVGFPIAAPYLQPLGTRQEQSAALLVYLPGTASRAHGNYGVTYELAVPLANPGSGPATFTLALSQPKVTQRAAQALLNYLDPPPAAVTFRGPVRIDWTDAANLPHTAFKHVVLHASEQGAPLASFTLPAGSHLEAKLTLNYPADATPPQLLTVGRAP